MKKFIKVELPDGDVIMNIDHIVDIEFKSEDTTVITLINGDYYIFRNISVQLLSCLEYHRIVERSGV